MATSPENVVVIKVDFEVSQAELQKKIARLNKSGAAVSIGKDLPEGNKKLTATFKKTGQTFNTAKANVEKSLKSIGDPYQNLRGTEHKGRAPRPVPTTEEKLNATIQKSLSKISSRTGKLQTGNIKTALAQPEKDAKIAQRQQNAQTRYTYAVKNAMDMESKRRAIAKTQNYWMTKINKTLRPFNKAIFETQMATLGVAFSFMSLINTVTGMFTKLTDLSGNIKGAAMSKALGGVDVLSNLGIDYKTFVDGWKSMTSILGIVNTMIEGIVAKALTPDIVKAITDVLSALSTELGKPEVTKALQEIVLALVDLAKAVIPLIVPLATIITYLGETGLLKVILAIILAASILLPFLSLVGGSFTVLSSSLTILSGIFTVILPLLATVSAVTVATFAAIGVVVLLVVGTIVNAFAEFQKTGDIVKSIIFGFIDTFGAFVDAIGGILNTLLGWTGKFNYTAGSATTGLKNMAGGYSQSTVTNNYNINGDVFDTAQLQTAINKTKGAQGVTY